MLLKCRSPESTSTNLHVKDRQSFQIHFQAHESALQTEFCDKLQVSLLPDLQKNNGQSAEHAEAAQWHPQIKTADIWQWRKVVEKERWEVAVACSARLCPQLSIPPLSAGGKSRKLLLYYSKSCGMFFPHLLSSASCLCGWFQALSLFYVQMHIQGFAARIFKGTAAFTKWGGQHCPSEENPQDSEALHARTPGKGNNPLSVFMPQWRSH